MKKVLVVEDNERNMYLISFILEKMGHRVLQADSGEKGVELASREQPDLILMDIQLPGIDGLEATKRIRQYGDIPIIAITSFAMTGDRERLIAAGCNGYIEKPINPE
ncbi:MAG: response regulator, partial [Thermodesulfovibrionales bacterium]